MQCCTSNYTYKSLRVCYHKISIEQKTYNNTLSGGIEPFFFARLACLEFLLQTYRTFL